MASSVSSGYYALQSRGVCRQSRALLSEAGGIKPASVRWLIHFLGRCRGTCGEFVADWLRDITFFKWSPDWLGLELDQTTRDLSRRSQADI